MPVVRSIAVATLAAACAACMPGSPAPRPASPTSACPGNVVLDVRNDYRQSVDVYVYVGTTKTFVGYASPGVASFTVPTSTGGYVGYAFAELNGRRVSASRGGSSVTIQRRCAEAN